MPGTQATASTRPLWRRCDDENPFAPLQHDLDVDVAIVGAGITGITLAALLKQGGRRVAVIEARDVGAGCTGHSTGHLSPLLDSGVCQVERLFGEEAAKLLARATIEAIDLVGTLVDVHRVECGYRRMPGYLFTEDESGVRELEQEMEAGVRAGLDMALVRETPLPFTVRLALRTQGGGQLDPRAYVTGMARSLAAQGVAIHPATRALDVEPGAPCRVFTERGTVRAADVVLATHSPIGVHLVQTELLPYSSYAIAAKLRGVAPPEGLFWDTADPYHYLTRHVYDDGVYLVAGGADHKTGSVEETGRHYDALEAYVRSRFPVAAITHRWSFDFFEPADQLPYVGRTPLANHVWFATGFSGDGLVLGPAAARLLADQLLGRASPYERLFDARRFKPRASAKRVFEEGLDVARHFIGDRIGNGGGAPEDLARGEGRVLVAQGERLACYRDEGGTLHAFSAVCPHMKCIVHWNGAEKSWDCPCHGSRFSALGELIAGPAQRPLTRKPID